MKPGSVPTARIAPILDALIKDRWPYSDEDVLACGDLGAGCAILADKAGCDPTTITKIVEQKNEGVDFDLADRLFCALGRPDVWRGELLDVYEEMEFMQKCSLHSCSKTFSEGKRRRKLYCSVNCKVLASHVSRGSRPGNRYLAKGYCQSGRHKMTPENTRTHSDGSGRYCRECDREKKAERNARYNAKRRALRAVTA